MDIKKIKNKYYCDGVEVVCATYSEMVENGKQLELDVENGKIVLEDGWTYIGCGWWSYFSPEIHVTKRI